MTEPDSSPSRLSTTVPALDNPFPPGPGDKARSCLGTELLPPQQKCAKDVSPSKQNRASTIPPQKHSSTLKLFSLHFSPSAEHPHAPSPSSSHQLRITASVYVMPVLPLGNLCSLSDLNEAARQGWVSELICTNWCWPGRIWKHWFICLFAAGCTVISQSLVCPTLHASGHQKSTRATSLHLHSNSEK